MNDLPRMHCHDELLEDRKKGGLLTDELLFKWYSDAYSTSRHLLSLYSIPVGLKAKTIAEVGFGRSSFVLARAASQLSAEFYSCDNRDFSYLLSKEEKKVTRFIHGNSDLLWPQLEEKGLDFAFLDYFSDPGLPVAFIEQEIRKCLALMKKNGIIAIHDSIDPSYRIAEALGAVGQRGLFARKEVEILSLPYNYGLALVRRISPSKYGSIADQYPKKEEC